MGEDLATVHAPEADPAINDAPMSARQTTAVFATRPSRLRSKWLLIAVLALAFAIRLPGIADPALDFHPVRQYFSAKIVRVMELDLGRSVDARRETAMREARPDFIEPPIMESIATPIVWATGTDPLTIGRLLAALIWTIGGAVVFRLVRRFASPIAGIASTVTFTFLPFAIAASRSFQPDPLMVVLIAMAATAIFDDRSKPSARSFRRAVIWSALAIAVKLVAVFFIFPMFGALWASSWFSRDRRLGRAAAFCAGSVTLAAIWQVLGTLVFGFLNGASGGRVIPHLLRDGQFWSGWTSNALGVVGGGLLITVIAALLATRGRGRALLGGLSLGYVVFGLTFTYHYMTHSYYHLPLVLIAAVAVGLVVNEVDRARRLAMPAHRNTMLLVSTLVVAAVTAVGTGPLIPHRISTQTRHLYVDATTQLGELTDHSSKVLFVSKVYGYEMQYYGITSGAAWPAAADLRYQQIQGLDQSTTREVFDHADTELGHIEFVAVTAIDEWDAQPELQNIVSELFSPVVDEPSYKLFRRNGLTD